MSNRDTIRVPEGADPHYTQLEVLRHPARQKVVMAGRRWGKTRMAATQVMMWIQEASRQRAIEPTGRDITSSLSPQVHVWVVGPNYDQLKMVMAEFALLIPKHMIMQKNESIARGNRTWETRLRLVYPNGQRQRGCVRENVLIEFKSAENWEALQTIGLDVLYVTESQNVRDEALEKVLPALISPYRLKAAMFEGIPPDSENHWFARRWALANRLNNDKMAAFKYKSTDNPHIGLEGYQEILDQKAIMTEEAWQRMYFAKQPKGSGAYFRNIFEAACLDEYEYKGPEIGERYVAGLDIGRRDSESVIIVKNSRTRESVYGEAFGDAKWEHQLQGFERVCKDWRVEVLHFDGTSAGGDIMHELLVNLSLPALPFNFSAKSKGELYSRLAVALEQGLVYFPKQWTMLIKQLQAVRKKQGKDLRFESDGGVLDDWVDAEALALAVCETDVIAQHLPAFKDTYGYEGVLPTQYANGGYVTVDGERRSNLMQRITRQLHEPSFEMWQAYEEAEQEADRLTYAR